MTTMIQPSTNFMQSLRSRFFFLLFSRNHMKEENIPPKPNQQRGIWVDGDGGWTIGSSHTLDSLSSCSDYITTLTYYILDYSILYERKCIHKNIMSFTKIFFLDVHFLRCVFGLFSLLFSIDHAITENLTDISQTAHFQTEKRRIFHLFFCCSVINVIQQLYRAALRMLLSRPSTR